MFLQSRWRKIASILDALNPIFPGLILPSDLDAHIERAYQINLKRSKVSSLKRNRKLDHGIRGYKWNLEILHEVLKEKFGSESFTFKRVKFSEVFDQKFKTKLNHGLAIIVGFINWNCFPDKPRHLNHSWSYCVSIDLKKRGSMTPIPDTFVVKDAINVLAKLSSCLKRANPYQNHLWVQRKCSHTFTV